MTTVNDISQALSQHKPDFDTDVHMVGGHWREDGTAKHDPGLLGYHSRTGVPFWVHASEAPYALAKLLVDRCEEAGRCECLGLGAGI